MKSIGVDLHVRNSYVTVLDGETGEISNRFRISNTREALTAFFRRFEGEQAKVVVEATTNTYPFVSLLRRIEGLEVTVVNPRKMRVIADSVCKTDKIDSEILAQFGLYRFGLPESYVPNAEVHDLRCELRSRAALVAMRTEFKNRVHGLINGEGFFQEPENLFGKTGRDWLSQLDLPEGARRRLDRYLGLIDLYDEELKRVDVILRNHYQRHPVWEEDVKLLLSMPGIGIVTALTVLSELGDWRRFHRPDAVTNFAGLVPRVDSSNNTFHYGRITKHGPRLLRWVLAEAAQVSRRYVPRYQSSYEQISRRSGKAAANVAIARKMLRHAWVMLHRREKFKYQTKGLRSQGESL